MESEIKKRVKSVMRELDISAYAIAKFRGLSDRTVLDQVNGNSKIGVATIDALLAYRPDISAEYIMRGNGPLLLSDENCTHISPAKITLELEVSQDQVIKLRLKDKVVQLAD